MEKKLFGTLPTGEEVYSYILKTENTEVEIMTRGAVIVRFVSFGTDIMGGFDTLEDYVLDDTYQGALVGRVANRIENGVFTMDGKEYHVTQNNNGNCLHGGKEGFTFKVFTEKSFKDNSLTFAYTSEDGEEGFPARLYTEVTYTLIDDTLVIDYTAIPDGKTPIALTNHAYFNLDGFGTDIMKHKVKIYADRYTEVDDRLIPTGNRPSVYGTALDFTTPHEIGERISEVGVGYDHNYIISSDIYETFVGRRVALASEVWGQRLKLTAYTDQPGIQLYTGNYLAKGPAFKGGIPKIAYGALCLEAQTEPNLVNRGESFYQKGEVYRQTTVYKVEKL